MPYFNKESGQWHCKDCNLGYKNEAYAYSCEQSHDKVMVEFKREDLMRLVEYIFHPDPSLLTKSLVETIMRYKSSMKGLIPKK